jgi:hypothetical protein
VAQGEGPEFKPQHLKKKKGKRIVPDGKPLKVQKLFSSAAFEYSNPNI